MRSLTGKQDFCKLLFLTNNIAQTDFSESNNKWKVSFLEIHLYNKKRLQKLISVQAHLESYKL